jgi:integrase/recombinase XerD
VTSMREHATAYLAMRRALGHRLECQGRLLLDFAARMDQAGQTCVTTRDALEWAVSSPGAGPVTRRLRLSVIRCFARHLAALDPACEVPPPGLLKAPARRPAPYLYSPQEISALVAAAGTLSPPVRAATMSAVISLLAATGMRIKEALTLTRGDVDLDAGVLRVTGKYGKVRLIPVHPSMTAVLAGYAALRDQHCPDPQAGTFFLASTGRALHPNIARATFWQILDRAGIQAPPGRPRPRLHDLRHSFAVATYLGWYRAGADVNAMAPVLSDYLGHRCPSDTYWYLTAAPELLTLAAQRLAPFKETRP